MPQLAQQEADEPVIELRPQTATRTFYFPQLDALRFFAFFSVYWFHSFQPVAWIGFMPSSFLSAATLASHASGYGLSLFFFLSSYLITSLLSIERRESGKVNLQDFYVRRILRIWPLYFMYVGVIALIGVRLRTWHVSAPRLFAMFFLAGNWYGIFAGLGNAATAALWSISVEEQFYIVWPSIFRSINRKAFIVFAIVLGICSLAATFVFGTFHASSAAIWLNSLSEAVFFAGGALLSLTMPARRVGNIWRALLLILSGLGIWVLAESIGHVNDRNAAVDPIASTFAYLLIAIGCGILLTGFLYFPAERVPQLIVYLGKISYGLYVFHGFAMHAYGYFLGSRYQHSGEIVINFMVTVALASLSYRFLEKPCLRLKERFELVKTRTA